MRALPLTDKARPGGRPRRSRAPANPFAAWLASCGKSPEKIAELLGCSASSVYNLRNGYFKPGRTLSNSIAELTIDPITGICAVPASTWEVARIRERSTPISRARRSRKRVAASARAA